MMYSLYRDFLQINAFKHNIASYKLDEETELSDFISLAKPHNNHNNKVIR